MIQFVNNVIIQTHRGEKLLSLLKENDIFPLFVPATYTDKLQPLCLGVNRKCKEEHFHDW